MPRRPILAMTPAEIQRADQLPPKIAWMACHFSPCGPGLTNLPTDLPPGSLLVVDDWTPICGHDPDVIGQQLLECFQCLQCSGVLLDLQRPENPQTGMLAQFLTEALPCPTVVSEHYAKDLSCPVFLPPVPPSVSLKTYLSPWQSREIWLDLSRNQEVLVLSENGCETLPGDDGDVPLNGFCDGQLHCHYQIQMTDPLATFTLWRTQEDLEELCREAEELGVAGFVGLYQELHANSPK